MSKYTREQYDDLAGWLKAEPYMGYTAFHEEQLANAKRRIAERLADHLAKDNPACCLHCGDEEGTTSICTKPNEGHSFMVGGFDRERFLRACGVPA